MGKESGGVIRLSKKLHTEHWKNIALLLALYDVVVVNVSYLTALWFRYDCTISMIPARYIAAWRGFMPVYTIFCLAVFWFLKLYRSLWRFASYSELMRVCLSSAITGVFHWAGITLIFRRMPISYYFIGAMLQFVAIIGIRFSYRFILLLRGRHGGSGGKVSRVMVVGAGAAGQVIIRDIHDAREVNAKVVCIIDDNSNKWKRYIDGVPIVGGRDDILSKAREYSVDKIYVAIPSASVEDRREILNICKETGCELKNLPGIYQLVNGEVSLRDMKDVAIEDLLGRAPIKVDLTEIFDYIAGKVILVTGGGGSIGSELCRQIAKHNPKRLIIFDIYENNAYDIQQELRRNCPDLKLSVEIGSVRDTRRINQIFKMYRPEIVYHAAAHKHVPLMEDSPCEAIKNNVFGTYKTAYAAATHGCRRFVLISTDKAVNPTNIMGASKRLCEMVVQTFDRLIKAGEFDRLPVLHAHRYDEDGSMEAIVPAEKPVTEFVAVRFGNVLGSNGSVIPLFKKQIATTRVVTVTHPDIIRYFMTIPEAVSLVLQASVYAKGGEIFVLDMGEPVKIDTLARNLIKLSGLKPDVDVKIEYTGLRPGEKLFEEKLMAEEGLKKTPNDLIHIGLPIPFDTDTFLDGLPQLMSAAYDNDADIRKKVAGLVTTYKTM